MSRSRHYRLFVACAGVLAVASFAQGGVIINEFSYDDASTDDREFIELHNNGVAAVDISGWVIRNPDTVAPPGDNNSDYTIPGAAGSGTTTVAPGGFYVVCNPAVL